jgi:hypothetical protein
LQFRRKLPITLEGIADAVRQFNVGEHMSATQGYRDYMIYRRLQSANACVRFDTADVTFSAIAGNDVSDGHALSWPRRDLNVAPALYGECLSWSL